MKLIHLLFICACVVLLSACKASPQLTSQAIEVEASELNQYWIASDEPFSVGEMPKARHITSGEVWVRYLIDSNGQTFNSEVVYSTPEGMWDNVARSAVGKIKYKPAPSNTKKQAVIVITEFNFNAPTPPTR